MPQSPQSKHLGTSHNPPNRHQLSCCIFLDVIVSLKSLSFQGDFSFGKSQKSQGTESGLCGAESPGLFDVSPKNSAQGMVHEWARCHDEAANNQSPIAAAF